jgi:hypothetical protein
MVRVTASRTRLSGVSRIETFQPWRHRANASYIGTIKGLVLQTLEKVHKEGLKGVGLQGRGIGHDKIGLARILQGIVEKIVLEEEIDVFKLGQIHRSGTKRNRRRKINVMLITYQPRIRLYALDHSVTSR